MDAHERPASREMEKQRMTLDELKAVLVPGSLYSIRTVGEDGETYSEPRDCTKAVLDLISLIDALNSENAMYRKTAGIASNSSSVPPTSYVMVKRI